MNSIDWSKAPPWANAVVKSATDSEGRRYWVEQWGGISKRQEVGRYVIDREVSDMIGSGSVWQLVERRPESLRATPATLASVEEPAPWNGEDLPPTGLLVEWQASSQHEWQRVTVLAYADGSAWIRPEQGESFIVGSPAGFRLIRTPEQIAAEARKEEINAMARLMGSIRADAPGYVLATALYDAGYRKQEVSQ